MLMSACGGRAAVFAGSDEAGYKYAVGEQGYPLAQRGQRRLEFVRYMAQHAVAIRFELGQAQA